MKHDMTSNLLGLSCACQTSINGEIQERTIRTTQERLEFKVLVTGSDGVQVAREVRLKRCFCAAISLFIRKIERLRA